MSYESHLLDVRGPNYRHLSPEHQFWKKKPPFGSCELLSDGINKQFNITLFFIQRYIEVIFTRSRSKVLRFVLMHHEVNNHYNIATKDVFLFAFKVVT